MDLLKRIEGVIKYSVNGCGFEGKRSDFILMTSEIEIDGKVKMIEVPVCYKCITRYFSKTNFSCAFTQKEKE